MNNSGIGDKMTVPYGFKAKANRIAIGIRHQLRLAKYAPIDVRELAAHLNLRIIPLSEFKEWCPEQVSQLNKRDGGQFSAALVYLGKGRRIIIVNDDHSSARQNSDIAHEISHALLAHPLADLSSMMSCRDFNQDLEDEASHLAGHLLIPNEAAKHIININMENDLAQASYGVSRKMLNWRLDTSGARPFRHRTASRRRPPLRQHRKPAPVQRYAPPRSR